MRKTFKLQWDAVTGAKSYLVKADDGEKVWNLEAATNSFSYFPPEGIYNVTVEAVFKDGTHSLPSENVLVIRQGVSPKNFRVV